MLLATTIMHARELPRDQAPETRSPLPALKKAITHARALLKYAEKPPARRSSVSIRCGSLRAALLSSAPLALALGIANANGDADFDYAALLDSLETGHADTSTIAALV